VLQPNRDRAEQGGNPAGAIIFDPACGAASPARRPLGGMIPALSGDHRLLNQELLTLRVRQLQVAKIAEITRAVDLQHVNAARRPLDPLSTKRNTQPIPDPQPAKHPPIILCSTRPPNFSTAPSVPAVR
jgi:hypothetical protein